MRKAILLLTLCAFMGCADSGHKKEKKEAVAPASLFSGYDLQQFQRLVLTEGLEEISGIAYDSSSHSLAAVNDEEGKIFFLDLLTGQIKNRIKFAGKGDYEELFYGFGAIWVLISSGQFIRVTLAGGQVKETKSLSLPVPDGGEFEAAWYDKGTGRVWMACKKCKGESLYMAGADGQGDGALDFTAVDLDFSALPAREGKQTFKASGACINPRDGYVYMLSSPDKKILKMTTTGKVLEMAKLDPVVFKQPEGICFTPDGSLYISNEGAGGNANLLIFKHKAPQQ